MTADTPVILIFSGDRASAERCRALVGERFPRAEIGVATTQDEAAAWADRAEIAYGWGFPPELFARTRSLRWIQKMGAGVEDVIANPLVPHDVLITRTPGAAIAATMSDYVLASLLNAKLRTRLGFELQQARKWSEYAVEPLEGCTAGVAGLGEIGAVIAERVRAIGVEVVGWRRSRPSREYAPYRVFHGPEALADFLAPCDFIILVLPLTDETRGLINRRTLAGVRRGAHLVNVGRGGLVDETALIEAIQSGQLSGATLDVCETEPLPPEHLLWRTPNVTITPHVAGPLVPEKVVPHFIANLRRYAARQPLRGLVDRTHGY
jgi:glyoxylate/hydroxypyruvate reductase